MRNLLLPLFMVACAGAHASTTQAWSDQRQQMLKACLAASQFKDAHALGKPAEFDDQVGYSALLIEGVYPQKHMNNRSGTELCLYSRQQQHAVVTEWNPGKP